MLQGCRIYGLGLAVNVPIAGLRGLPPTDRIDVSLTLGPIPERLSADLPYRDRYIAPAADDEEPPVRVAIRADGAFHSVTYADGTRVFVDAAAANVWAEGPEAAGVEDTATYLLGPALGFVLRLRGVTCLHASAVALGGRAVAFVGNAGAGKSSLAAAFAQLGHSVLTDDVAPITDHGRHFEIQPAYPRVRLWPDSVEALFGSPDELPVITPGWDKRFLDLNAPRRFEPSPLPLGAIYFLGARRRGELPEFVGLEGPEGLIALVSDTYTSRWLDRGLRAKEFDLLARVAEHVPLRRVHPVDDASALPDLCDAILRDLEASALTR